MKFLYVHTKGASPCECYLSNLQMLKKPLVYEGLTYPSIEHAFQAAKYNYITMRSTAKRGGEELKRLFTVGEEYGKLPATQACSKGKRGTMDKKHKVDLDLHRWNAVSLQVMKKLMAERAKVDRVFVACLIDARKGLKIYHKEKGVNAFWGGHFTDKDRTKFQGQNHMGLLLEQLGDHLLDLYGSEHFSKDLPKSFADCSFKKSAAAEKRSRRGIVGSRKTSGSRKKRTASTSRKRVSRKRVSRKTSGSRKKRTASTSRKRVSRKRVSRKTSGSRKKRTKSRK